MCGLGGVPGNPLALSLLATPLRYYSPTFLRLTAGVLYGPSITPREDLLREQIGARRARPPTLWGYASQLVAGAGWTSRPWLGRIAAPTLVLAGDRDPIVPPRNARILARNIPSARLELVPGAGHLLLFDQAVHCAAVVADFLNEEPEPQSPQRDGPSDP
jgi:pimeloyl-ACP methyl ester carboxylesterase